MNILKKIYRRKQLKHYRKIRDRANREITKIFINPNSLEFTFWSRVYARYWKKCNELSTE